MTIDLKRATFNEVAELYDEARNTYPDALFDNLLSLTGAPPACRTLEIGPGTGIATAPLARRGCVITAVELGAEMARVAERNLAAYPNVSVVVGAFEQWQPPAHASFDLVFSATAFHWIDPAVKFIKTAALLKDGGYLAVARYKHVYGGDASFFERVQSCYDLYKPGASGGFVLPQPSAVVPDTAEIEASGLFDKPVVRTWLTEETYSRDRYIRLLSTYSDHRAMEPAARESLFACIGTLIDREYGGQVRKLYMHELVAARKRG